MADYHSLLTRAVANLPSGGTPGTREAIYVRARNALIEQLRSLRPPLPESDIAREANALDAAIAKIEANFPSQQSARSSASPPPAASTSPPGGKAGASPPPSPKPVAPTAPAQPAASQRPRYARAGAERAHGRVSRSAGERAETAVPSRVASAGRVRSTGGSAANAVAAHVAAAGPTGAERGAASIDRAGGQAGRRHRPARGSLFAGPASTCRRRGEARALARDENRSRVLGRSERRPGGQFPPAARSRQGGSVNPRG